MINLNYIIIYILGLYIGYYINECVVQIPEGEFKQILPFGSSHKKQQRCIQTYIPIIHCFYAEDEGQEHKPMTLRYLVVELLVSILTVLIYHQYGITFQAIPIFLLACTLVLLSLIDLDRMIIPDPINAFIGITGVLFILLKLTVPLSQGILGSIIGGGSLLLLGYLSLWILKKEGMGGGDIKLMAVSGFYLGVNKTVFALIMTGYITGFFLVILLLLKKLKKDQYIPFGPFLSAGIIISILFYEKFMSWYWRMLL